MLPDGSVNRLRRVVVTGIGAVTPLGVSFVDSWMNLLLQKSGLTSLHEALQWQYSGLNHHHSIHRKSNASSSSSSWVEEYEYELAKTLSCQVAAPVRYPQSSLLTTAKLLNDDGLARAPVQNSAHILGNTSHMTRATLWAILAAQQALHQAQCYPDCEYDSLTTTARGGDVHARMKNTENIRQEGYWWWDPSRMGVSVGTGLSSLRDIASTMAMIQQNYPLSLLTEQQHQHHPFHKMSPYFCTKVLSNTPASRIALEYPGCFMGPNHAPTTACAAGAHAIGDAYWCIQQGQADLMLAGGTESCLDVWSMASFSRLRALSTQYNDTPCLASRPFDSNRDGFVMGEGAAVLVLEELEHVRCRQRQLHHNNSASSNKQVPIPILAELVGYSTTSDGGYHPTAPHPTGKGAELAIHRALHMAQLSPSQIDYVNAHATSTPKGDEIEASVLHRVFVEEENRYIAVQRDSQQNQPLLSSNEQGQQRRPLFVSSTKGATGHLLGAAGAVEAAFSVQALVDQKVPVTLNLQDPPSPLATHPEHISTFPTGSQEFDRREIVFASSATIPPATTSTTNNTRMPSQQLITPTLDAVMSNSFGFGGTNACLIFRRFQDSAEE